jgi:hypothetical protein
MNLQTEKKGRGTEANYVSRAVSDVSVNRPNAHCVWEIILGTHLSFLSGYGPKFRSSTWVQQKFLPASDLLACQPSHPSGMIKLIPMGKTSSLLRCAPLSRPQDQVDPCMGGNN